MTKRHMRIRNMTVVLTVLAAVGLSIYGRTVNEIKRDVEEQIAQQQNEIDEKNGELAEMKQQYDQMDSEEYIRKIAAEELGMVDKDTTVFQIKN